MVKGKSKSHTWPQAFTRLKMRSLTNCLEKAMAPCSSTLAWKIPWMEEPSRLQSIGSLRVGHDWATSLSFFTFMHWRRKWQCSCLENPRDGVAWWAAIYGVAQSQTWLKLLSSSSSNQLLVISIKDATRWNRSLLSLRKMLLALKMFEFMSVKLVSQRSKRISKHQLSVHSFIQSPNKHS